MARSIPSTSTTISTTRSGTSRSPTARIRAGFTPIAIALAGDVLVFTPKRVGKDFEAQRSFATIECGKWVGAARAAFNGVVVAANAELERRPKLLNEDAFGVGWMLIVRACRRRLAGSPGNWRGRGSSLCRMDRRRGLQGPCGIGS